MPERGNRIFLSINRFSDSSSVAAASMIFDVGMGSERRAAPLRQPIVPFAVTILQASAKPLPLPGAINGTTTNAGALNGDFLSQGSDGRASIASPQPVKREETRRAGASGCCGAVL
jgi:hypothetical protein